MPSHIFEQWVAFEPAVLKRHALHCATGARGLLLGLFGFAGFFATVSMFVTRLSLVGTFAIAFAVNLLIQGATLLVMRRTRD